ncbi:MAG: TIGR03905 family TSCPD domain-containing protein [Bacillota bacterium]|nr:TIGR03905 family TSCPD domain-containing protein [Bacillota bacterium]
MKHLYKTKGVCSQWIGVEIEGDTVQNVEFFGGCEGNLKAIPKLVRGMKIDRVAELLKGNTCGNKGTSCADQMVCALEEARAAAAAEEAGAAADGKK